MRYSLYLLLGLVTMSCSTVDEPPPQNPSTGDVIYEVFVRNYSPSGTIQAVTNDLPRLEELGVNVLWLMPIQPIGEEARKGTFGSPYSIKDYSAISPDLGTEADFKAFVDAAHARGMKVVLDWVANHTAWDHHWVDEFPSFYTRMEDGSMVSPVPDWSDVADLNYDEPALHEAMIAEMQWWIDTFGIDGFRCDVAEMVPDSFWTKAWQSLQADRDLWLLAEGGVPHLLDLGFDLVYAWTPYHAMKAVADGEQTIEGFWTEVMAYEEQFPPGNNRMRFTTNHDETAWDAPPVIRLGSVELSQAMAVATFFLPGSPLIYNGQEVGSRAYTPLFEHEPINLFAENDGMWSFYTDLVRTWRDVSPSADHSVVPLTDAGILGYTLRTSAGEDEVLVAVNPGDQPVALRIPDAWEMVMRAADVQDNPDGMVLPAKGYLVATR